MNIILQLHVLILDFYQNLKKNKSFYLNICLDGVGKNVKFNQKSRYAKEKTSGY